MASKAVKLCDLKVADLKRELEERDLDTTGTKSVLLERLRQALLGEGNDPDSFLFESELNKMFCSLENKMESFESNIKSLENNIKSDMCKMENKMESFESNIKSLENNIKSDMSQFENNIKSDMCKMENKMESLENNIKSDMCKMENKIESKFETFSNNVEIKVASLESNVNSMEEKFNEIKNELEEKVRALEDKLGNSFKLGMDTLNNDASTTSCDPLSAQHGQGTRETGSSEESKVPRMHEVFPGTLGNHSAVPVFDGKMPLEDYLTLFDTAAMVHGWSSEAKASVLCLSLRGEALGVLQSLPLAERQNYSEVVKRLEMRFGHRHMEQLYRSQLRNRIQKPNETLQEFEADIARLVRSAYPSVTDDVCESLAVDKFLDGLREAETQQAVKLARPKTLSDALTQALEFEAVKQSLRGQARVRAAEVEPTTSPTIEEIVRKVLEALKARKREEPGKLKRVDGEEQLSTRKLKAPKNDAKVACLGSRANSFYIDGLVNGQLRSLLLDTGATMTILREDIVCPENIFRTSWSVKTATGQPAKVYGETVASFVIGGCNFDHCALVADIEEEVILGTDIMKTHGFTLDLSKGVATLGRDELILRHGKDLCGKARLMEDTTLPARSQVLAKAALEKGLQMGQSVLLEPPSQHEHLAKGVLTARSLVTTRASIPVRLMNLNEYPVTIGKGTVVGQFTPASAIVRRVQHSMTHGKDLPPQLTRLIDRACEELAPEEREEVKGLITRWKDVFEIEGTPRGRTDIVKHRINTGEARPIRQAPRRLPLAKREEAEKIIQEMRSDGIIEPSNSPWVSPVVLVKKKDGSTRFCVDYRLLNDVTKKDSYPLPRIDDTLDTLGGCKLFSTLDLRSGYWQVGLAPEDKEKTAFSIGSGLWQFTVMPFGLCNAPATFERLMENVLRGLSWETCLVYLDDIIVVGKSFSDHLQNIEKVLERLHAANLKLNPKKCNLFRRQVSYLGHIVSDQGVSVDPEKVIAITDWPIPRDKHQVRSFLGLCTYYRRFVKGFANIAKPLTKLTEEKRTFHWDDSCQQAFEELKTRLSSAPILSYPRSEGKFILDTDASNMAIGSVLSQLQDGEERVIGYFSKVLSAPERNYCVTRRELLAVVKSVEHFHKYLYGRRFLLRTDHAALMWLMRFKTPEGQVARWIERLQEYDFESTHRSGVSHRNADALSRRPCEENCKHCSRQEEKTATAMRTTIVDEDYQATALTKDQESDPDLRHLIEWKRSDKGRPSWQDVAPLSGKVKTYWAQWNSILLDNGVLKRAVESVDGGNRKLQLIVPRSRVPDVLKEIHDGSSGGHLGVHRTLEKVRERFYWVNLKNDVIDWCRRCITCAASNGPLRKQKAPMRQYNVGAPFERIAIDVAGPFPMTDSGNKYILVAMDYFSKWVEAYALPNQEAITVADILVKEFFSRFGVPLELHSDQGRNFESAVFSGVCKALDIRKTRTTPLHPQSDGMVERMNRTMGRYLSKVVSDHQRDWDQYIHLFLLAYRSSINETTGQTPASIVFGRELRLPCDLRFGFRPDEDIAGDDYVSNLRRKMEDIHEKVRSNIHDASDKMKARYDINAEHGGFKPGDVVWLYNPRRRRGYSPKLQTQWEGPFEVVKRINDVVYRIRKPPKGKPRIVHFNRLAPYKGDHGPSKEDQVAVNTTRMMEQQGLEKVVHKDIFTLPKDYALAHCVAKDLRMSKGIATVFRKKFGGIMELESQSPCIGRTLHLLKDGRHLFYLVTKEQSFQKPTYEALRESLLHLRAQLLRHGVVKLALPRIGCGYDGLDGAAVRKLIKEVFEDSCIEVVVCVFDPGGFKKEDNADGLTRNPTGSHPQVWSGTDQSYGGGNVTAPVGGGPRALAIREAPHRNWAYGIPGIT